MFADVVAAGDVAKSSLGMAGGSLCQDLSDGVVLREGRSQAAHAPGPAQVQTVQVNDLRIGAIGNLGGLKQRLGLALGQIRQETPQPGPELSRRQDAPHQVSLHQTR